MQAAGRGKGISPAVFVCKETGSRWQNRYDSVTSARNMAPIRSAFPPPAAYTALSAGKSSSPHPARAAYDTDARRPVPRPGRGSV